MDGDENGAAENVHEEWPPTSCHPGLSQPDAERKRDADDEKSKVLRFAQRDANADRR